MKYFLCACWLIIFPLVFSGCKQQQPSIGATPSEPANIKATIIETSTPTLLASQTQTSTPSPIFSLTATKTTILPSTPTSTKTAAATIDLSHVVTATHSPAQECPKQDPAIRPPDFEKLTDWSIPGPKHLQQNYLDFFNAGGIIDVLPRFWRPDYVIDLTNDGSPEYIITYRDLFILGCQSGQYQILWNINYFGDGGGNFVEKIRDANLNGLPEMILTVRTSSTYVDLVEWDGSKFSSLFIRGDRNIFNEGFKSLIGRLKFEYVPSNKTPFLDLAVTIRIPEFWVDNLDYYIEGFPWRDEVDYYKWNGSNFVFYKHEYSQSKYRFQTVNDADWAFIYGDFRKAISLYQQAISDDNLLWYTDDRRKNTLYEELYYYRNKNEKPAYPIYDPDEYPNLAAYSYFRMILAQIKSGDLLAARKIYDWLQANFPTDKPGHTYAELASIFWNEYQVSQNFGKSCEKTYEYSTANIEGIFRYLAESVTVGGKKIEWPNPTVFGKQSAELQYSPEMICPSK